MKTLQEPNSAKSIVDMVLEEEAEGLGLTKSEILQRWKTQPETDPRELLEAFEPVPAGKKGSRFGECGIRVDGTLRHIFAVIGRLKPYILLDNTETRLELGIMPIKERTKTGENTVSFGEFTGRYSCYIRFSERTENGKRYAKSREDLLEHSDELESILSE